MSFLRLDVKNYPFCAAGDGKADDTNAIQSAINAAKTLSSSKRLAAVVSLPIGEYLISQPLKLPASGNNRQIVVHLVGHPGGSCIRGSDARDGINNIPLFPEGAGLAA